MKDVDEMVKSLLHMDVIKDGWISFTDEAKQLIHAIAEECKDFRIVADNMGKLEEYMEGLSAEDVYVDMLYKVAHAPTRLHMVMSAYLLITAVDWKLSRITTGGYIGCLKEVERGDE